MKFCLAFVAFSAWLAVAATGTISGTVADDHGVPEKNLVLEYEQLYDGPTMAACCPHTKTDENGHFSFKIEILREPDGTLFGGRWAVYPCFAIVDADGYPCNDLDGATRYYPPPHVPFYRTENTRHWIIDVTPEAPNAVVDIKLGPKAGAIMGRVTDTVTGAPIKPYADIVVAWAGEPTKMMATETDFRAGRVDPGTGKWISMGNGKYRILVPPDTELTLKAITKGYKPYQYQGVITVGSGQDKVLDIQLQPEDK